MLLLTWVYRYLFETLFSFVLGVYPEEKFLDDIILFLFFWGTTTLFSTMIIPLYILNISAQEFQFLHILTNRCYFLLLLLLLPF